VAGLGVASRLCRRAADALAANYSVIIDAVSLRPAERWSFAADAAAAGVPFLGLWLVAPAAAMDRRLRARRHDASDASPEVLAQQLRQDAGAMGWVRTDAGAGAEECLSVARRALTGG
jgi:predicted kinase